MTLFDGYGLITSYGNWLQYGYEHTAPVKVAKYYEGIDDYGFHHRLEVTITSISSPSLVLKLGRSTKVGYIVFALNTSMEI